MKFPRGEFRLGERFEVLRRTDVKPNADPKDRLRMIYQSKDLPNVGLSIPFFLAVGQARRTLRTKDARSHAKTLPASGGSYGSRRDLAVRRSAISKPSVNLA
jgi:hypothetical protein